jgi:hypothetical protein
VSWPDGRKRKGPRGRPGRGESQAHQPALEPLAKVRITLCGSPTSMMTFAHLYGNFIAFFVTLQNE